MKLKKGKEYFWFFRGYEYRIKLTKIVDQKTKGVVEGLSEMLGIPIDDPERVFIDADILEVTAVPSPQDDKVSIKPNVMVDPKWDKISQCGYRVSAAALYENSQAAEVATLEPETFVGKEIKDIELQMRQYGSFYGNDMTIMGIHGHPVNFLVKDGVIRSYLDRSTGCKTIEFGGKK